MPIQKRKIGIIGSGHVGSHIALLAAEEALADEIVLYDISSLKAEAQVMDIQDTLSYFRTYSSIYAGTIADMRDADVMVMSAGSPRISGQNRLDKMESSIAICKKIIPEIEHSAFGGIIVSVTNPCDIIAAYIQKILDWPVQRILGSGTALDSARFRNILSLQLHTDPHSVMAYVLGEHGDSSMIPWSHVSIGECPVQSWMTENRGSYSGHWRDSLLEEVHRRASLEVQGKGSTEFGIASSVCEMIRAFFHNEHKLLPCSVFLKDCMGSVRDLHLCRSSWDPKELKK